MAQTFRQPEILDLAREQGRATVDGLAQRFGVTVQTIRRDLTDLAQAGRLDQVFDGGPIADIGLRKPFQIMSMPSVGSSRLVCQKYSRSVNIFDYWKCEAITSCSVKVGQG